MKFPFSVFYLPVLCFVLLIFAIVLSSCNPKHDFKGNSTNSSSSGREDTFKVTVCMPSLPCKIFTGVRDLDCIPRSDGTWIIKQNGKKYYYPTQYTMAEQE